MTFVRRNVVREVSMRSIMVGICMVSNEIRVDAYAKSNLRPLDQGLK